MPEEISGADIVYAQLREGDLLRFDLLLHINCEVI